MISERTDAHILNERLHDLVLVRHVGHHVGHVVIGGAHQGGTEHDGQVPRFHLIKKKQRVYYMPSTGLQTDLKLEQYLIFL